MIASCPACTGRFNLDRQRFSGKRVTLRCPRCRKVFQVEVPSPPADLDRRSVMVAHADEELCATIGELLQRDAITHTICRDGETALKQMEANPPQVVIADVALPGLYAFEVVEKVRSRPGLENVRIILLSSVYNKTAYKRTPASLYGADDYIEKHHLPTDLVPKVFALMSRSESTTLAVATSSPPPAPMEEKPVTPDTSFAEIDAINERIQQAEESEIAASSDGDAAEKARRLARIIVSDIALYSQSRVEEGIRQGTFFDLLANEIAEGRRLYLERVGTTLSTDYLEEAFATFIARRRQELLG